MILQTGIFDQELVYAEYHKILLIEINNIIQIPHWKIAKLPVIIAMVFILIFHRRWCTIAESGPTLAMGYLIIHLLTL